MWFYAIQNDFQLDTEKNQINRILNVAFQYWWRLGFWKNLGELIGDS